MKCPSCGVAMKPLFTSYFCPENCDKPELKAKRQYQMSMDTWKTVPVAPSSVWGVAPFIPAPQPVPAGKQKFLVTELKATYHGMAPPAPMYLDPSLKPGNTCPICAGIIRVVRPKYPGAKVFCGDPTLPMVSPGGQQSASTHAWEVEPTP